MIKYALAVIATLGAEPSTTRSYDTAVACNQALISVWQDNQFSTCKAFDGDTQKFVSHDAPQRRIDYIGPYTGSVLEAVILNRSRALAR